MGTIATKTNQNTWGLVSGDSVRMVAPWFMFPKLGIVLDPSCGEGGHYANVFWEDQEEVSLVRHCDLVLAPKSTPTVRAVG